MSRPIHTLPPKPSFEHLQRQAKDLRKAVRRSEPDALARVRTTTSAAHQATVETDAPRFSINDAYRVLAREYGFPGWAALKREVERRTLSLAEATDAFMRAICDQKPDRARQLLEDNPPIANAGWYPALVLGDVEHVGQQLQEDPARATRPGGPKPDWQPLHYVAISPLFEDSPERRLGLLATARLLLDHGADPNAEYRHPLWPDSPLRPLYHATGVVDHPELALLLIEAGADINDGESIYHATEHMHRGALKVLSQAGVSLGLHKTWGNTPLYFILGYRNAHENATNSEAAVHWFLEHGADPKQGSVRNGESALHAAVRTFRPESIILALLDHGADPGHPANDGKTPVDLALETGQRSTLEIFREHGAAMPEISTRQAFLGACMSADREGAESALRAQPDLLDSLTETEKLLLGEAATENRAQAVALMLDLGFDITFKGSREWGATPLHLAAWHGQADAALVLLERGAPMDVKANPPEDSEPPGWAAHGSGHCRNPRGDYVTIVQAMLERGARFHPHAGEMASDAVAALLDQHSDD